MSLQWWPLGRWWPERAGLTSPVSSMAQRMTRAAAQSAVSRGPVVFAGDGGGVGGERRGRGAEVRAPVWAGWLPRGLSLWRVEGVPSLRPHTVVPWCVCVLIASSYKDPSPIGSGPPKELISPKWPL